MVHRCCLVLLFTAALAQAADWPRFHGPDGTGLSSETNLARAWPAGAPRVLWTQSVGIGYGGVAVRDGSVYLLDWLNSQQEALRCLDLNTGQEKWRHAFATAGQFPYPGSRTVPTVDQGHVYIQSASGLLQCLDLTDRRVVWSRNLVTEFGALAPPLWGFTQNPTIAGNHLIVAPHATNAGVIAIDKATGKTVWQSGDIGRNNFSYVTPYVTTLAGTPQIVTIANAAAERQSPALLSGVELISGRILWQTKTARPYAIPIPQPVRVADDRLFVTGGYGIGCFGVEVQRTNGAWTVKDYFRDNPLVNSHIHNPLFYRGHIYAQSHAKISTNSHNGLVCVDPEGRLQWKTGPDRLFGKGGLLIADGLIFVVNDPVGELVLVEATPAAYRELGRAKILAGKDGNIWAPLALADGKLLLRDQHELKCVDVR